ncbi:MAG: alkaline phosphatase family protein, partial [Dehalococcoidia bacterium]|nr:alkaline phosphatase family protein [Dehalococcoidia bacterium]
MSSVLVFVFDGLQPAQVNTRLMPNLSAFAANGVTFVNHHAVFPSVTRVNCSSMVTGMDPGGHGLA